MNKNSIKNYAVWARQTLIHQMLEKAYNIGISKKEIKKLKQVGNKFFLEDKIISKKIKIQRDSLISKINKNGFEETMEEIACTWFNRFITLRYMEVNKYIPFKIFSFKKEELLKSEIILKSLKCNSEIHLNKFLKLKKENKIEELYKYCLIFQYNQLSESFPFLFKKINDWEELLLPDNLLNKNSIIMQLVQCIKEEDFKEIEIIGWLYQFYISEKKQQVFANIKKKIKVSKENLPVATQLFTPKWIIKYMLENSLGRILNLHNNIKNQFKYYIEDSNQLESVTKMLDSIKEFYKNFNIENITILDPACGSGHILVYAFDLLYELYLKEGYDEKEIPKIIIEKNLYGLDIDYRACWLSIFSVIMKGREKNKDFFNQIKKEKININITYIEETKNINKYKYFLIDNKVDNKEYAKKQIDYLFDKFLDGKEYGSIIKIDKFDKDFWKERLEFINNYIPNSKFTKEFQYFKEKLNSVYKQAIIMIKKYDIVCTNPPYLGIRKGMNSKLSKYVSKNFPNSRNDLFSVFIERSFDFSKKQGFIAMITQHSWMFLSSYEKLREHIINKKTIVNMLHLGTKAFEDIAGEVVQTTAFVLFNNDIKNFQGTYIRLIDYNSSEEKEKAFLSKKEIYVCNNLNYYKIPGSPIVYWINDPIREIFKIGKPLKYIAEPKQGMATTDNNKFLRYWTEININEIGLNFKSAEEAKESKFSWFPYNKGGKMRKWYGNNKYIVNYENNGDILIDLVKKKYPNITDPEFVIKNRKYYFKKSITWSFVSSSNFGVRYSPYGFIFDVGGSSLFPKDEDFYYILAFLCSKLAFIFLNILNPTMNFQVGNIGLLPIIKTKDKIKKYKIEVLAKECIEISKKNWDSFEMSWDFTIHPLLKYKNETNLIKNAYNNWESTCNSQFNKLKNNEEEINKLFINIYGLEKYIDYKLKEEDITIKKANLNREIKSFISYAVGCMFGRYSLDNLGLQYAGGDFNKYNYTTFKVSENNIIPILNNETKYFQKDIVSNFFDFVRITFGNEQLIYNIDFIAQVLGKKDGEKPKDTIKRYFLNEFYKDHLKIYNKRPIYWLFTSGKNKAFNALIYIHRYDKNLISKISKEYISKYKIYLSEKAYNLNNLASNDSSNKSKLKVLNKKINKIKKYAKETKEYDELLNDFIKSNIEIKLQEGIKINYNKFGNLLYKI
ncbi:hypothetical protein CLOACE_01260 [Clostridium acetireducens DSM 10703]|uniref:site-specific DNA-methyltransferase (adenine-specific) n=1 Tax=Clostridium acetireducens DSM 10703 TaxID=1121290 RepID=A0A1E8F354_9CLOT|nr:BREX-1 system adenine-specific DNA-methyltransferase PglX [Clostridium acetireducens]OFI07778.1 hypothetical protein CLOACE_01260 [Clostridium acetireducens DSM 10703]